jgi:hypothetical protein
VSSRLMTVLQTAAFPFCHCTDLGSCTRFQREPSLFQRATLCQLSQAASWSGWLVTIQRPPRPKRGALPTELHPVVVAFPTGIEPACLPVRSRALVQLSYGKIGATYGTRTHVAALRTRMPGR